MKKFAPLLALLILIGCARAVQVIVDIKGTINGRINFFNFSLPLDKPLAFYLDCENIGSVSCKARMRVDFFKDSERVYTAWSKEARLEPGASELLEAYYYPNSEGNYSAHVYLYFCNSIQEINQTNFTFVPRNLTSMPIEIKRASSTEDWVEIEFVPRKNLSLIIFPSTYPLGWQFESLKVQASANQTQKVRINYEPQIWKPRPVKLALVSEDGKYFKEVELKLEKPLDFEKILIEVLSALLSFSVLLNLLFLFKLRKFKG